MKKTRNELRENLINEIAMELNSSDRKIRLKGRNNQMVLDMVELSPLATYKNLINNSKVGINKGSIVENIVLDWKGLETETRYCEVKFFGNDTPNPLTNESVRLVYIVIAKATEKGAYIIRNVKAIRNQRLTLKFLKENNLLTHRCEELERYLGLNA